MNKKWLDRIEPQLRANGIDFDLLWTTTNSAGIHPDKFARMCQKGLENAGLKSAKLERIAPMPVDFPSIGAQPMKNLVWRI